MKFANSYTSIPTEYLVLIKSSCKFILYDRGNLWRKKGGENNESLFAVVQGPYWEQSYVN